MKGYIIVILLLNCVIGYCSSIYQNKIFGAMAHQRIDSIRVHFFHPLNLSNLTITVKTNNKGVSFTLDSLACKEADRNVINDDVPDDCEFVHYPAKLSFDDEDFLLSCINVFFISKTGKIFKFRRKEKFCIESDDDYLGITYYKGQRKEKMDSCYVMFIIPNRLVLPMRHINTHASSCVSCN